MDLEPSAPITRRLTVDSIPDDRGHRWQRLYFNDELVDTRCTGCSARPLDLIASTDGDLRQCSVIEAVLRSFL